MKWMGLAGVFGCWLGGFWLFVFLFGFVGSGVLVVLFVWCWFGGVFGHSHSLLLHTKDVKFASSQ